MWDRKFDIRLKFFDMISPNLSLGRIKEIRNFIRFSKETGWNSFQKLNIKIRRIFEFDNS